MNAAPVLEAIQPALSPARVFFGWVNRTFRCAERQFEFNQDAGRVTLTTQRDDPGVWTDMLTADYTTGTSSTDVFTSDGPDSPTNLTTTSVGLGIEFNITPPAYMPPGSVLELWEYTASTPFSSATRVAQDIANRFILRKFDTTTRYYWVRVRARNGNVSGTYPASAGVAGPADLVAASGISDSPADSNIVYAIATQPVTELAGINGYVDFTSPANRATRVQVSWSAQAQISNTTSGVAVGTARIYAKVFIDGSQVFLQDFILEGNTTAAASWGALSGSKTFDVAANAHIEAYLQVARQFSSSGSSPAQTITWRAALLDLFPFKG